MRWSLPSVSPSLIERKFANIPLNIRLTKDMQLASLALAALLGGGADAFVPPAPAARYRCRRGGVVVLALLPSNDGTEIENREQRNTSCYDDDARDDDDIFGVFGGAVRNSVLGTVAAAAIFAGAASLVPDADFVANAAVPPPATTVFSPKRTTTAATATATTTAATATAKPAAVVVAPPSAVPPKAAVAKSPPPRPSSAAPLSAEKAALEYARSRYSDLRRPLRDAKAAASASSSSYDASVSARESAQKRAVEAKKALLSVNDKLAAARGKKKNAAIVDVYVTEAEKFRGASQDADAALSRAKDAERVAKGDLASREKAYSGLEKSVESSKKAVSDAEKKFDGAKKKLKENQEKAEREAKAAKDEAAEKAKKDKKKAEEA